jgi:hypothetical protein
MIFYTTQRYGIKIQRFTYMIDSWKSVFDIEAKGADVEDMSLIKYYRISVEL